MRGTSIWARLCAPASALFLLAAACGTAGSGGAGTRVAPDDAGLHQEIAAGATGSEVTFDATVESDPTQVGTHEHLLVLTTTGERLEIDHNTSLATAVPAHRGDRIIVHGQLYIDPGPKAGVHCTHAHTSRGCPIPGWIEFAGAYYE
ncbi:MAG: hypothetical protein NVS9B1_06110 [Candidatus Dormibacteraceae bacterium]